MIRRYSRPRSKVQKPWLIDFILEGNDTAHNVKVIQHLEGPREDGSIVRQVSDGVFFIKAIFSGKAVAEFEQTFLREDECTPPNWDRALLLIRKCHLKFEPHVYLNNCEFVVVIDDFSLWEIHKGFDGKNTIHDCMQHPKVKEEAHKRWTKWRDESKAPDPDMSMTSIPLTQLLEEIGKADIDVPDNVEEDQEKAEDEPVSEAEQAASKIISLSSTAIQELMETGLLVTDFLVKPEEMRKLDSIKEWKENYHPPPSLDSKSSSCESSGQLFVGPTLVSSSPPKLRQACTQMSSEKKVLTGVAENDQLSKEHVPMPMLKNSDVSKSEERRKTSAKGGYTEYDNQNIHETFRTKSPHSESFIAKSNKESSISESMHKELSAEELPHRELFTSRSAWVTRNVVGFTSKSSSGSENQNSIVVSFPQNSQVTDTYPSFMDDGESIQFSCSLPDNDSCSPSCYETATGSPNTFVDKESSLETAGEGVNEELSIKAAGKKLDKELSVKDAREVLDKKSSIKGGGVGLDRVSSIETEWEGDKDSSMEVSAPPSPDEITSAEPFETTHLMSNLIDASEDSASLQHKNLCFDDNAGYPSTQPFVCQMSPESPERYHDGENDEFHDKSDKETGLKGKYSDAVRGPHNDQVSPPGQFGVNTTDDTSFCQSTQPQGTRSLRPDFFLSPISKISKESPHDISTHFYNSDDGRARNTTIVIETEIDEETRLQSLATPKERKYLFKNRERSTSALMQKYSSDHGKFSINTISELLRTDLPVSEGTDEVETGTAKKTLPEIFSRTDSVQAEHSEMTHVQNQNHAQTLSNETKCTVSGAEKVASKNNEIYQYSNPHKKGASELRGNDFKGFKRKCTRPIEMWSEEINNDHYSVKTKEVVPQAETMSVSQIVRSDDENDKNNTGRRTLPQSKILHEVMHERSDLPPCKQLKLTTKNRNNQHTQTSSGKTSSGEMEEYNKNENGTNLLRKVYHSIFRQKSSKETQSSTTVNENGAIETCSKPECRSEKAKNVSKFRIDRPTRNKTDTNNNNNQSVIPVEDVAVGIDDFLPLSGRIPNTPEADSIIKETERIVHASNGHEAHFSQPKLQSSVLSSMCIKSKDFRLSVKPCKRQHMANRESHKDPLEYFIDEEIFQSCTPPGEKQLHADPKGTYSEVISSQNSLPSYQPVREQTSETARQIKQQAVCNIVESSQSQVIKDLLNITPSTDIGRRLMEFKLSDVLLVRSNMVYQM